MEHHHVSELDLSLSRGVWRENLWGYSPQSAPPGAKVAVWFDHHDETQVDELWRKLTNALSGQLCASLNFLDGTRTVSPEYSFRPRGVKAKEVNGSEQFRLGFLPGENVCTENLTPWKKLLPCESKRGNLNLLISWNNIDKALLFHLGLSTLLNSVNLHRSKYHSLGLSLRYVCPNGQESCSNPILEHSQTITLVFNPTKMTENLQAKIMSWSLRSIFGIGLNSGCPLASQSHIYLDTTDRNDINVTPNEGLKQIQMGHKKLFVLDTEDLLQRDINNVVVNYPKPKSLDAVNFGGTGLSATRYLVGHGQEKGEVVTKIKNSYDTSLYVVYLEQLPWFLRLYYHTLTIRRDNGDKIEPTVEKFDPGVDRVKPYSLEMVIELPPKSTTTISIAFEKSILKWLEYPPDANHGFYVPAAVISALTPDRKNFTSLPKVCSDYFNCYNQKNTEENWDTLIQLYTETLLVNLPTPDFSMPYNVICLACTVVALAFGPLHNITTKELVVVEGEEKQEGYLKKILKICKRKSVIWKLLGLALFLAILFFLIFENYISEELKWW